MANYHRGPPTREIPPVTRSRVHQSLPGGFDEPDPDLSLYTTPTLLPENSQEHHDSEGDLLAAPVTDHHDSDEENLLEIDEYLISESPYPTPPSLSTSSDDEIPTVPLIPRLPSPLPTIPRPPSPSPSASSDDEPLIPRNNMPSYTEQTRFKESVVIGLHRAKDIPILADGELITPTNVYNWARAVRECKVRNKFTEQDAVECIGGSFQAQYLADWFDANSATLIAGGVDAYLAAFTAYVLDEDWVRDVHGQILSARQGNKQFKLWYVEITNLNNVLGMAPAGASVTKLSDDALRAQLTANLNDNLRNYVNENNLGAGITDLHKWAAAITKADTRLRAETTRSTAAAAALFARLQGTANTGAKPKKTLLERLANTPTPVVPLPSTAAPRLGKLSDDNKSLLDAHSGCRRCRVFYAGHETADCPMAKSGTWPDPKTLLPLTLENALKRKAETQGRVPLGALNLFSSPPAEDEYRVDYGGDYTDEEGNAMLDEAPPADVFTDEYVPVSTDLTQPHLYARANMVHADPNSSPIAIRALIDVGCPSVVMSKALADRLGLERHPLPRGEDNLEDLAKNPLVSKHYVWASFKVDGWTSDVFRAKVIDTLFVPLILGIPFLSHHHIVLDVRARTAVDARTGFNIADSPPPISLQRPTSNSVPVASMPRPAKAPMHTPALAPSKNSSMPQVSLQPSAPPPLPLPPIAGVTNPGPVLAAIRQRIETLSQQERCDAIDARLRERFKDRFPETLPDVDVNALPDHIFHRIKLKNPDLVIKQRAYAAPKRYLESWKRVLDGHLRAGRIRPSSSAYSSPAFCIPKNRDGVPALDLDPRWVNDYRAINSNTVRDQFPLPRVEDVLADCGRGKFFAKMDMTNSFFQTRVHPDDIHLTAVRTPWGLYEWVVMPMGGCNGLSTHQRRMSDALRELHAICHAYLDDIVVWGETEEELEENVARVLEALRAANLYCNPAKSTLCATEISFLGHVVSAQGISADPRKTDKILNWPAPKTATNVRGFIGLTRYIAAFLPALAEYTSVLTPLTHPECDKKFPPWLPEHQDAFDKIKDLVANTANLTVIDYNDISKKIFVTTDASDRRTGAVLSFGETWETARPVAYDSYQLNPAEKNYPVHERELLAIVKALKKWRTSLLGVHFSVYTDHRTLEYFNSQKDMSPRQMRWSTYLSDYDYDIVYVRGEDNTAADALSRMPDDPPSARLAACAIAYTRSPPQLPEPVVARLQVGGVLSITTDASFLQNITEGYKTDTHAQQVIAALEAGSLAGARSENGLLYVGSRLLIPDNKSVRESLYHAAHDVLGHYGFDKSYEALRGSYYWPNMRRDLESAYIPSCSDCQRNKDRTSKPVGPLHPLPVPDSRFTTVGLDFIGPLPLDKGYDTVLTMTDLLGGADVQVAPTHSKDTAQQSAATFFEYWYCENGLPLHLVCDRDPLWISAFWTALHKLTGVSIKMSSSYHPQTDGGSERTNKTFNQALRFMVDQNQKGWSSKLRRFRFAFMNTVNASTGFSGFQLKSGHSPRLIPPLSNDSTLTSAAERNAHDIIRQINLDVKEAQDHLLAAKIRQAFHANQHRAPEIAYNIGDKVMLSTENRRRAYKRKGKKRAAKFMPRYDGPYTITAVHPEKSEYTLHLPNNPTAYPGFHSSLLKPYIANDPELFPNREPSRPGPVVTENGMEEHVIDRILDARRHYGKKWYLVRWKGYGPEDDEWKSYEEMEDTEALDIWEAEHGTEV